MGSKDGAPRSTPVLFILPTVAFILNKAARDAGCTIDPSTSVATEKGVNPAAIPTALPEAVPHGV